MMSQLARVFPLVCALHLAAADWTMYLRDPAHSSFAPEETGIGRDNAPSLAPAWRGRAGGQLAAGASYAAGVLYFGDWNGTFRAVDAATGRELWTRFVGMSPAPEDPACSPALGVTAQAAVVDDTVYVGGGDSAVYALDRATGDIRWRVPIGDPAAGAYLWSSITPYRGALYIGVSSLGDCPLVRGALVRIDAAQPENPKFAWFAPEGEVGGGIWSTPAIDEETNTIFVTTGTGEQDTATGMWGGTFASLDADTLEIKAHYFLPTNSLEDDIEWGSSPTLFTTEAGDKLVAATGKDGVLYALRREDMSIAWQTKLAVSCICPQCGCGSLSTPSFDGRKLYVGSGVIDPESFSEGGVYAVDPASGAPLWTRETAGVVIAPVTVANGLVYAATTKGLVVIDAATGEQLWDDGNFGMLYSQPVVAGGAVYGTYVSGDYVAWAPGASGAGPASEPAAQARPGRLERRVRRR